MTMTHGQANSTRKSVSLRRGQRGYGFNLAEEFPCYLSAVHEGSVAWKTGLRAGDQLVAIGNTDVTRISHKDIVKMIAETEDALRLTVLAPSNQSQHQNDKNCMEISSRSSSSDCDSDHEIWRRKKSDLAQKFERECPRRSRYKNLITPISEVLVEDGAVDPCGSLLRNGGGGGARRYISTNGRTSLGRIPIQKGRISGQSNLDSAMIAQPIWMGENKKIRPISVLEPYEMNARHSRSPTKIPMKQNIGNGNANAKNRSCSAPAYKRALSKANGTNEASTVACVGSINGEFSSSNDEWGGENSSENEDEEEEDLIKKSVVVYIGAVPVPSVGASRKNILKSALQSLRAQRVRAHTVLLEIFTNQIVITNSKGVMTNRFGADRIAYATSCAENKQYFGIMTMMNNKWRQDGASSRLTTTTDETDDSPMTALLSDQNCSSDTTMVCHVFAVDPQLHLHSFHYHYARKFGIHCVRDAETNFCQEFPYSTNSILHAIGYVYRNRRSNISTPNRCQLDGKVVGKWPAGTYISSNSDSGIGNGKEDFSPSLASKPPPAYPGASARLHTKLDSASSLGDGVGLAIKKAKAVRFADDQQTVLSSSQNVDRVPSAMSTRSGDGNQDLVSTVSGAPVSGLSARKKDSKEHPVHQTGQHYASSSAIDVRQLVEGSTGNDHVRGYIPLGVTKSVAGIGNPKLTAVSTVTGSAGEIRCGSPKSSLGGSTEQVNSSRLAAAKQTLQSGKENCTGSASSVWSVGEVSGRHQQALVEPNSKCSRASTGTSNTKHGSLLRDRINRRLSRAAGGDQGGCAVRTSSIKMKQAQKERLESWSSDFDRLLRDPTGLYAFSEFLRTQYCQENVNFWIACENYKIADENMRAHLACELYRNYFAAGCMEPVNVDSLAKQSIQEAMETESFTSSTFNAAQYQIFHLMKYDCYPRFLKSDEYQRCWELSEKGQHLPEMKEPFLNNVDLAGGSSLSLTSKASCSATSEEQQKKPAASSRKSILPWKNKFTGGVNIIGRHKGKKEEDSLTPSAQQPSASAHPAIGAGTSAATDEASFAERAAALSSVGSKRKQAWRHSKQLSTPAEAIHAVRKASGSVEGLHPIYAKPSSAVTLSHPPDVVPQPDPPSSPSPSPGTRARNAAHLHQQSQLVNPGSPLAKRAPRGNTDGAKSSCTLILPSRERIQAEVSEDLTVRRWLHELSLQYGLNAAATDIIDLESNEPVDLSLNASRALAGKVVRLEGGVLFKVDLPCSAAVVSSPASVHAAEASQRKLIAVKARADSAAGQVLRPILNKYGLLLDSMVICVAGTNEVLPNHSPISTANNKKLMVLTQSEFEEWVHRDHYNAALLGSRSSPSRSTPSPSFEDIIGAKYFQELPSHRGLGIAELPPEPEGGKAARHLQQLTSTNGGHKHVGGMLKFVKRGAAEATSAAATKILGQQAKSLRLSSNPHSQQQHPAATATQQSGNPGKRSVLSKQELLDLVKEEKRLAELLGRAQASSFDDQRGSCVKNFELPDFLKQPTTSTSSRLDNKAGPSSTSSRDDSVLTAGNTAGPSGFCYSRPTDLVHRKLCGPKSDTKGVLSADGSCDDDFGNEELDEMRNDPLPTAALAVNGDKLDETKIPTHEEADALFGGDKDDSATVDFNDPLMTERRRLSDFGLGPASTSIVTSENLLDDSIKSGLLDEHAAVRSMSTGTPPTSCPRPPPPPYRPTRVADTTTPTKTNKDDPASQKKEASSVNDLAGLMDTEKKRRGLYVQHQDDDWQVDYV